MNTQYRKNLKAVAQACKDYTDKEIKKVYYDIGHNDITTDDHTDEATYRFTAPANAKLLMLQSVAGNSVKYSPSVASDNNATHIKTLPSTVYDLDISKVEGVGYKVNQLVANGNFATTDGWTFFSSLSTVSISNNEATVTSGGTACSVYRTLGTTIPSGRKVLMICQAKSSDITGAIGLNIRGDTTSYEAVGSLSSSYSSFGAILTTDNTNAIEFYKTASSGSITYRNVNFFDLTADFGSGNEPSTVSDCATAYLQRGINIYEYTPQQSSIKNNAFTGVTVVGTNVLPPNLNPNYNKDGSLSSSGNVNTDGVITVNVNANYYAGKGFLLDDYLKPNTTYTFKCVCSNASVMYYNIYNNNENVSVVSATNTFTFTTPSVLNDFIIGFSATTIGVTLSNLMLNEGSSAIDYIPYTSQTIPIDLTTIKDSNNVSLFPSGKMMGNSSVADFITPYNQESRWDEYTFTGNESVSARTVAEGYNGYTINEVLDYKVHTTNFVSNLGLESRTNVYSISGIELDTNKMYITFPTSQGIDTTAKCIAFLTGKTIQYERATYLTSNTDLTSLTGIQGQILGTITLNNTDNVDMPNLISYNAIIKHALATAVKHDGANIYDGISTYNGVMNNTYANSIDLGNLALGTYTISFNVIANAGNRTFAIYTYSNGSIVDSIVSSVSGTGAKNYTFTLSTSNYDDVRLGLNTGGVDYTIQLEKLMLEVGSTAHYYRPYKPSETRALTNNEAKYSWGITTGVRNVRTYCDDEGNAVNEGSLSVNSLDLGTLNYSKDGDNRFYNRYGNDLKVINNANIIANIMCRKYNTVAFADVNYRTQVGIASIISSNIASIFTYDTNINDTTVYKQSVNGVPLFYEKNATDTETLDDFDYFFDCEEGDTFTLVNTEQLQCYATYSFLIKEAKSNE